MVNEAKAERNLYQNKVDKLETDLKELQILCSELGHKLEEYRGIEVQLNDREVEFSSLRSALSMKEQEAGEAVLWASKVKNLLDEVDGVEVTSVGPLVEDSVPQDSPHIMKLIYITTNFAKLKHRFNTLSLDNEGLQGTVATQLHEIEHLRQLAEASSQSEQELVKIRSELFDLVSGMKKIIHILGGSNMVTNNSVPTNVVVEELEKLVMAKIADCEDSKSKINELDLMLNGSRKVAEELLSKVKVLEDSLELRDASVEMHQESVSSDLELTRVKSELLCLMGGLEKIFQNLGGRDQKPLGPNDLVEVLEKRIVAIIVENNQSKSKADELDFKLLVSQKTVDELLSKVKVLEDSLRTRAAPAEIIQVRSIFEAPSPPSTSEISEVEDTGSLAKPGISSVPSAAHVRTMRKGSSERIGCMDITD